MGARFLFLSTHGFDVQAQREALLGTCKVEERGADHALQHRRRVVGRGDAARDTVQEVLVLVKRSEDCAVAPKKIDVAGDTGKGILWREIKLQAKRFEFVGRVDRPGITLGRKDRGARGVQGTERLEDGQVTFRFGDLVDRVRVFAKVDEVGSGICGIGPGDDEDRIVCGTLGGPLKEHLLSVAARGGLERTPRWQRVIRQESHLPSF